VINDPNVITIQRELPKEQALLAAIYSCNYAAFFKAVSLPCVFCGCLGLNDCSAPAMCGALWRANVDKLGGVLSGAVNLHTSCTILHILALAVI
jgi:hypothetical protein